VGGPLNAFKFKFTRTRPRGSSFSRLGPAGPGRRALGAHLTRAAQGWIAQTAGFQTSLFSRPALLWAASIAPRRDWTHLGRLWLNSVQPAAERFLT
jgi:hypothetical protein